MAYSPKPPKHLSPGFQLQSKSSNKVVEIKSWISKKKLHKIGQFLYITMFFVKKEIEQISWRNLTSDVLVQLHHWN